MVKEIICKQCGALNILGQISEHEDIVPCDIHKDLEWFLPMAKTTPKTGEPEYTDQKGILMSRAEYIKTHKLDPEIAQEKMKYHIGVYVGD